MHQFYLIVCWWLACLAPALQGVHVRHARPIITAIHPSKGPSTGGYRVTVYGRELAWLDSDIQAFVGNKSCTKPRVLIGWEKFSVEVPPCERCGATTFSAFILNQRSNSLDYTVTDKCLGPTGDPGLKPILPPRWSAEENCTICTEVVHLATSTLADNFRYNSIFDALSRACASNHILNYSFPTSPTCHDDYSIACRILVEARATRLANFIWDFWDLYYWEGKLPVWACRDAQYCGPFLNASGDPMFES